MSENPPWLDEAWRRFKDDLLTADLAVAFRNAVIFAARQPRPITDAIVEVVADEWWGAAARDGETRAWARNRARAALEAAEGERCK